MNITKRIFLIMFLSTLGLFSIGCADDLMADDEMMHDNDYVPLDEEDTMVEADEEGSSDSVMMSGDHVSFKCDDGYTFDLTGTNKALGYVCELKATDGNGNPRGEWNARNEKDYCKRQYAGFEKARAEKGVKCEEA